jgi:hypothetical protein
MADLTMEENMDRAGSDDTGVALSIRDPEVCRMKCANDARCRAYTYRRSTAMCWLKDSVPAAQSDLDTVAGFKLPPP